MTPWTSEGSAAVSPMLFVVPQHPFYSWVTRLARAAWRLSVPKAEPQLQLRPAPRCDIGAFELDEMALTYYTILYYTILYYTILYYTILYYTILYYTILYYTILYYTILYYTILYYTILYYTSNKQMTLQRFSSVGKAWD